MSKKDDPLPIKFPSFGYEYNETIAQERRKIKKRIIGRR